MSSREADIEKLNYAITSLNEDAEGIHGLISKSTSELENATAASNRAADNAAEIIESLAPLTGILAVQHQNSTAMLEEARKASEEQRETISGQIGAMRDTVNETLESISTKIEADSEAFRNMQTESFTTQNRAFTAILEETRRASEEQRETISGQIDATRDAVNEALDSVKDGVNAICETLSSTVDDAFKEFKGAQDEAIDEIRTKNLKEHERTRDALQADVLNFKNATSARLDALEAEVSKAGSTMKELEVKITESVDSSIKRLLIPIYAAVGLGVVDLACLLLLLIG